MRFGTSFKQSEIGMIPHDWTVKTINEIQSKTKSALAMGPFGSNIKKEFFVSNGVPIIRGNNLTSYRFNDKDFVYLTEEKADELRSSNCRPGDIVITHRGTLGQVGLIPKKQGFRRYVISQSGMKLSCDESQAISEYVFYFLKSPVGQRLLLRNTSQTGVPAIAQPLTSLKNIPLPIPNINEQKRITKMLDDLNDRIDLLGKQNEILEEIGRALFQYWFIAFEFPDDEGRPYKSTGGELIDSELGKIPKDWRVVPLSEAFDINPTRSLPKGKVAPYVEMANMPTDYARVVNFRDRQFTAGSTFINGDTLVARITPCLENGKTAIVDFLENESMGWGSTEFIVIRPKPPLPPEYGYFLSRTERFRTYAISNMNGSSGRQRVPTNCFSSFSIVVPDVTVADLFGNLAQNLFRSMKHWDDESKLLANVRDTLLPLLISGKIRIPGET